MTARHREVYDFVASFFAEHGYAPTLDQICTAVGYASRSAAHNAVWALISEGYLTGSPGRTLQLGAQKPE